MSYYKKDGQYMCSENITLVLKIIKYFIASHFDD